MCKNSIFKQLVGAALVSLTSTAVLPGEITGEFSRAFSGEGVQRIQLVFTIEGDGTSEYTVFAQGPSLANEGVTGFLANPKISLIQNGQTIAANDNWGDDGNANRTQEVAEYFGVTLDPLDAALVRNLGAGLYTVGVDGADGGVGITRVGAIDSSGAPVGTEKEVTPGLWTGEGVCFFVNADGTKLVESDMCDNGKSFAAEITGIEVDFDGKGDGDVCQSNVACIGSWNIKDEYDEVNQVTITIARCSDGLGGLGYVSFFTGSKAKVYAFESEGVEGRFCYAPVGDALDATPAQ